MSLPTLAPFPPANVRLGLAHEEWEAYLDAWLTLSELTLRLSDSDFQSISRANGSLPVFLVSFYRQSSQASSQDDQISQSKVQTLRTRCFFLVKRIFTNVETFSEELLGWDFLTSFCCSYLKRSALREVMGVLWKRKSDILTASLQKRKELLIKSLESRGSESQVDSLNQLATLIHASPAIGEYFMTGSDFLDAFMTAYQTSDDSPLHKNLANTAALGLESLLLVEVPNTSLLSDHLYSLKSHADGLPGVPSLLADIVTNTATLSKLNRLLDSKAPERLSKILSALETYRAPSIARPRRHVRQKSAKAVGISRQTDDTLHFHRLTLVTQIQDLFPDLGTGFILKALDEYDGDVEQVTAHLLDDSLPPRLASLDRSTQAPLPALDPQTSIDHLAPRSTPPPRLEPSRPSFIPERHNIFDNDDLSLHTDRLLHPSKPRRRLSPSPPRNKAAILSALATFDQDDDERDDTYDVDDVGGTIDTSAPDGEQATGRRPGPDAHQHDLTLFAAWKSHPELFARSADVRRSQPRVALRSETGWTDEAIEGWAIMLLRDPRRVQRLEERAMTGSGKGAFDGRQDEVRATAYREGGGETTTEDEGEDGGSGGLTRGGGTRGRGGRGRGGRGRGRGGNVAGPSGDPGTAAAQRRKEASKGSRANHNRRDQRARKMARGGFSG